MTRRDALIQAGPILYGPAWQSALARSLGPHHPDGPREAIDDRLVRRWAAGQRPIPDWTIRALLELLQERAQAAGDVGRAIAQMLDAEKGA